MNKVFKTILIIFIALFSVGVLLVPSTQAQAQDNLEVDFETTPLFDETNFLPGNSVTRWVKVTNNSGDTQKVATEAINFLGFPDPTAVPSDDLSRALLIIIREKGGSDLYGGSTGEKTLFNFYEDGETYLSDIASGSFEEYEYEISFPSEKKNEWQTKTTYFDILIGFQGSEGGEGGGGGGGGLPRGLTIFNEAEFNIQETSVTINWLTNYPATSQVVYAAEGESYGFDLTEPNYGYPHATPDPEDPTKVTGHSVDITGLTPGTTYYYRCVSHASFAVSTEHSFTTLGMREEGVGEEETPPLEGPEAPGGELPIPPPEYPGETVPPSGPAQEGPSGEEVALGPAPEEEIPIGEKPEEEPETDFEKFLATVGNFFRFENPYLVLFLGIIILFFVFLFSKKKREEKEKEPEIQ